MAEFNQGHPEPPRFFGKEDILELLVEHGYDESNCFIEAQGYQLLAELAHNFVEEVIDTYKHKKREISVNDIKKAVYLKFPEVYQGDTADNKVIVQNRANALDQNDDRVREVEKKYNQ